MDPCDPWESSLTALIARRCATKSSLIGESLGKAHPSDLLA